MECSKAKYKLKKKKKYNETKQFTMKAIQSLASHCPFYKIKSMCTLCKHLIVFKQYNPLHSWTGLVLAALSSDFGFPFQLFLRLLVINLQTEPFRIYCVHDFFVSSQSGLHTFIFSFQHS